MFGAAFMGYHWINLPARQLSGTRRPRTFDQEAAGADGGRKAAAKQKEKETGAGSAYLNYAERAAVIRHSSPTKRAILDP